MRVLVLALLAISLTLVSSRDIEVVEVSEDWETSLTEDEDLSQDGTYVQILGHSGKIRLCDEPNCNGSEVFTIDMDSIHEFDSNGDQFNGPEHSYNTFAKTDFVFSDLTHGEYYGLGVDRINFSAPLTSNSADCDLEVSLMLFEEPGNFTLEDDPDNAVIVANNGSMKFNIILDNWAFCTKSDKSCKIKGTPQDGAYLQFQISIKSNDGLPDIESSSSGDVSYVWADGTSLTLVSGVTVDGEWAQMPQGYPRYTAQGQTAVFTFWFPKGESIVYDPEMTLGDTVTSTTSAGSTTSSVGSTTASVGSTTASVGSTTASAMGSTTANEGSTTASATGSTTASAMGSTTASAGSTTASATGSTTASEGSTTGEATPTTTMEPTTKTSWVNTTTSNANEKVLSMACFMITLAIAKII